MLKGKGISDGIGLGKVVLLKNEDIKPEKIRIENVEQEKKIFYEAVYVVEEETEEAPSNFSLNINVNNEIGNTAWDLVKRYKANK